MIFLKQFVQIFLRKFLEYKKVAIIFFLSLCLTLSPAVISAQTTPQQLVQEGKAFYEAGELNEAITSLQEAVDLFRAEKQQQNLAVTLTNLGNIQLTLGQANKALETWQQAQEVYQDLADASRVSLSQINQSRALQALGLYPRACRTLIQAFQLAPLNCNDLTQENLQQLKRNPLPPAVQVAGLRSLGNLFRGMGKLEESQLVLVQAVTEATSLSPQTKGATQLSLANTLRARGNLERDRLSKAEYQHLPWRYTPKNPPTEAETFYQQADSKYLALSQDTSLPTNLKIRAQLNHLSLLLEGGKQPQPQDLAIDVEVLPLSRSKVYARINYAKSLAFLQQQSSPTPQSLESNQSTKNQHPLPKSISLPTTWETVTNLLNTALTEAQELEDSYAKAYALGNLASLEEYFATIAQKPTESQQWRKQAQKLTEEALLILQPQANPEAAYQWQWQLGRLLASQGERQGAISTYESAAQTLDQVRRNLITINSDVQFSFRDNVEPLYRELVALLLPKGETNPPQENLKKSLYYVEALQLAELENFLRCTVQNQDAEGLLTGESNNQQAQIELLIKRINRVIQDDPKQKPAFLYPILLPEQVAVILKLPNQEELVYRITTKDKDEVEKVVAEAIATLKIKADLDPNQEQPFKDLYQILLANSIPDLEQAQVKTLIFILDNVFRPIPMSALHNGQNYLAAQDYATVVVPTVQLLQPLSFQPQQLTALIGGAIKHRDGFNPLEDKVKVQIAALKKLLPNSKIISNGNFTKANIQQELAANYYPILHLVTHGKFASDPQKTFIMTDDEANNLEDYSLNINEFENLLQTGKQNQAIELLVLSACDSAEGDNRAVLGIAGVAVKSGAKGTIAPLWTVDQGSSNLLVEKFYENLVTKEVGKAKALHLAQQYVLRKSNYKSPYHWSPFVLVGN